MAKGWTTVALKDALVAQIDRFLAENDEAFSNRAEVVTAALREFLDGKRRLTREDLATALKAVALSDPQTIQAFTAALLEELDPHTPTPAGKASKTESTRRQ